MTGNDNTEASIQAPVPSRRPYTREGWLLVCVLFLLGAIYGGTYLKRGWIPHDSGAYALAAERTLHGELPNRDFVDLYTGGLTELNALAMRIAGVNLAAIRYPVFLLFLAWIPVVFSIARRFASDYAAALVTLLAIVTSVPNYFEAVPSWYNLFFATFAVLALFRFVESRRRTWLFVSGVCAGLSFLAKISGLYLLAAGLLFLLYYEQDADLLEDGEPEVRGRTFKVFVGVASAALVLLLLKLINWSHDPRYWIHFVLPGLALVMLLVWREFHASYMPPGPRFQHLFADALPLLAGFALPVALFLVPYMASGSLSVWFQNVFVLPTKRLDFASRKPAGLNPIATCILLCGIIAARDLRKPLSGIAKVVIGVALAAVVIAAGYQKFPYHLLWYALVLIVPAATLVGALSRRTNAHVFALLSTVALCSLIQYPYAAPIYLVYVLPLVALVSLSLIAVNPGYSRFIGAAIALTYLVYFALRFTPSYVYAMGVANTGNSQTYALNLPLAAGIRVIPSEGKTYERVVSLIQEHRRGAYIYAAPDAPELYFLSASASPSRSTFDFLEEPPKAQDVRDLLARRGINVIVIKTPEFTGNSKSAVPGFSELDPNVLATLRGLYPQSEIVGNFEVRWQ